MSYFINIEVEGFSFRFGDMGIGYGPGLNIDFSDQTIIKAIKDKNPKLLDAIQSVFESHELIHAQYIMDNFEHYYLQGHPWHSLMNNYSFKGLSEFKRQAELVLSNDSGSSDYQKQIAKTVLETLAGNPPQYERPEKSPEELARSSFEKKKPKLKLKLTIRDGYKCHNCGQNKEDSLCVMKNKLELEGYELDNLVLRCRKCINILKVKK